MYRYITNVYSVLTIHLYSVFYSQQLYHWCRVRMSRENVCQLLFDTADFFELSHETSSSVAEVAEKQEEKES